MKKWTSLILLLTFFSCNKIIDFFPKPDPDPKPPLPSFNHVFGGQEYDYGNAITATQDSGYLFAGSTQSSDFDARLRFWSDNTFFGYFFVYADAHN